MRMQVVICGLTIPILLLLFLSLSARSRSLVINKSTNSTLVKAIQPQTQTSDKKQTLYNLFTADIHTIPLEELIASVKQARRDAQLRYVVIYGAACSYCLGRAARLEGSYLRTFALELKEQLDQTLATFVTTILVGPRRRLDVGGATEPPL